MDISNQHSLPANPSKAKKSPIIRVVVDHRESQSGVPEFLKQIPHVDVQLQQLTTGDYQIQNRWCFERKTLVDFARSIIDGRLFSQASRLASSRTSTAIILEGKGSDLSSLKIRREALQGAMISLTLIFGIPVLRSMDPAETARVMIYAARQLDRHEAHAFPQNRKRAKSKRKIQSRILQALPGIGPERAEILLDRFGSVQAVMTANLEELQKIDGIGEKIAGGVRLVLQEEFSCYSFLPSVYQPPAR
jgi:ERCC4-type nuclease